MRIAIVGGGISGLTCAHLLHAHHDVTVFESDNRLGGHSHTVRVEHEGREHDVDTGFIVYNERNYPLFTRLLEQLGVSTKPAPMTFGIRDDQAGLEYGGASATALFAQRRNLVRPRFWQLINDYRRFGTLAPQRLDEEPDDQTLGGFLERHDFSDAFARWYLYPISAAIWSAPLQSMAAFPLKFLVRFFENHGMLRLADRPAWRTVDGGSQRYVSALVRPFERKARLDAAVDRVERDDAGVTVWARGEPSRFDQVIFACHSDQALNMLAAPSRQEADILGHMPYQMNDVVLHGDRSVLPRRPRAWSSWNFHVRDGQEHATLTYNMSILQSLETRTPINVTLNETDAIDAARIYTRHRYAHPVFTHDSLRSQSRHSEISGPNRTHYCGAYWFNGFHEDGVRSAHRVCEGLGVTDA